MDGTDPLSQLADIHLPEPLGLWPLAPGWWVLFVLLCLLAYVGGRRFYAQWRRQRACHFAIRELDKSLHAYRAAMQASPELADASRLNFVNEMNAVMRRVALKNFPSAAVASLGGREWIAFIRTHGDACLLDDKLAETLSQGRFAKQWEVDEQTLYRMAQQWISSLYLAKIDASHSSKTTSTAVSEHA